MVSVSRMVVAVDGSHESLGAVQWAARLAGSCRADVLLVHASGLLEHLAEDDADIRQHVEEEWARPLSLAGIPFEILVVDGPPAQVILETARRTGADLIVVGSRGSGQHPAGTLGSTSLEVARCAPCPVAIVPG